MKDYSKKEILKKIKQKKELSGTADSVVEETLNNYITKYNLSISNLPSRQLKIIIKEVRAKLRSLTGQFQKTSKNRANFLSSPKALLKTHTSTAERIKGYSKLKSIIKKINPQSILDLGCGLNPIALASKKTKYYASDIKEDELDIIKQFFKKNKINGKTFVYDLRKISKQDLPKADLCLIFKVLDIIDKNLSEKIILSIPCKKIMVSFSTIKISGKRMNHPKRIWFEKILERKELKYKKFQIDNEVFYLIENSNQ
ncbi:MAG: hypothetical protein ABIG28_03320 [archaeon]